MSYKGQIGFDNELYLNLQSKNILERIKQFNNKLYLEFGGKIFDDLHAARVLPGFDPNIKTKLLVKLKKEAEIIFCISANDIEKNKIRADLGLSYDDEVLRLIDNLRELELYVSAIVITLFKGQQGAQKFARKLENRGERVYFHNYTKGYPNDVETIVSDEGYGTNPYIETSRPLVIVTAPGPSSGKLATCLSQMYHEYQRGIKAGYAKFETFPVWDLPLKHPVNIAYEAATADLKDINQIDPFHFNAYGKLAINYNRDIEVFPVLHNILKRITGGEPYKSPTDMGVNMVAKAITNDEIVKEASKREVVRRYFRAQCDYKKGSGNLDTLQRLEFLMAESELGNDFLEVVKQSKKTSKESGYPCIAMELNSGEIVTGKTKTIVSAAAAVVLNALRTIEGMNDNKEVIPDNILMPIIKFRKQYLNKKQSVLTLDDVLIALAISSASNPKAAMIIKHLSKLEGCEAHCTYMLPSAEELTMKKLGINITCEPQFLNNNLFQ